MTGAELKAIRHALGLTAREMGKALGYRGHDQSKRVQVNQMEDCKPIPPWIERLATMFQRHGIPEEWK